MLSRIACEVPDVIVCDMRMPEGSGFEVLAHIQAYRPELLGKLALASGDTSFNAPVPGLDRVAKLRKPYRRHDLVKMVARLAGREVPAPSSTH